MERLCKSRIGQPRQHECSPLLIWTPCAAPPAWANHSVRRDEATAAKEPSINLQNFNKTSVLPICFYSPQTRQLMMVLTSSRRPMVLRQGEADARTLLSFSLTHGVNDARTESLVFDMMNLHNVSNGYYQEPLYRLRSWQRDSAEITSPA